MPILCRVTRGDLTESIHVIFATVVDDSGNIVFSTGDPNYVTCIRSSLKPFQAEDGIRDVERSRGLGDVYKRQVISQGNKSK